jgi:hypothetical protein
MGIETMNLRNTTVTYALVPLLALAFGASGCFSSSSDSGGAGMSDRDAAVAGMIAAGMADGLEDYADDPNVDEPARHGGALMAQSALNNECGGSGHLYVTESTVSGSSLGLDTAFGYTGSIEQVEVDADCSMSSTGIVSNSHGYTRFGHSPDGTVFFGETTPGPGQSADDGPYIATMDWSGFMSMHQESQMYVHMCNGCPELGGGSNAEMHLFADVKIEMEMPEEPPIDIHFRWGYNSSDRAHVQMMDIGSGTVEYQIDGFMAFEDKENGCQFAADFDTVDPIILQGLGTEQISATGGELHMTPEGGGNTVQVVYHSDGSATVNGTTYTQEELWGMVDDCSSDI